MGNTNQKASGELNKKKKKKSDDDNVVVKKWEQQLQLFKDKNPVLTMFTQFINKLQQQVELCLTKFGSNCQAVDPPPQKLPQQNKTNSLALWQVSAVGGYFVVKWAWAKWNEQRTKKKSSDDPF